MFPGSRSVLIAKPELNTGQERFSTALARFIMSRNSTGGVAVEILTPAKYATMNISLAHNVRWRLNYENRR